VTIFGESAGAGSVAVHLTSARSWAATDGPLFTGGLMESGSPATPWNSQNMTYAESRARHYASALNCTDSDTGAHDVTAEEVACMRSKSAQEVLDARHGMPDSLLTWSPVEDGVQLAEAPRLSIANGNFGSNVSITLGTNGDEGSEFTGLPWDATEGEYEVYMKSIFGDELGEEVVATYPAAYYNDSGIEGKGVSGHGPYYASSRAFGDAVFSCPARQVARAWSKIEAGEPAYVYFFNHTVHALQVAEDLDPNINPPPASQMGVFHGTDLVFVFELNPALDLGANFSSNADDIYTETELSKIFGGYWSSFAAHKSPGSTWPQFNDGGSTDEIFMYLDTTAVTADGNGLKTSVCDFWDENPPPVSAVFGPAVF